jgi:hypothetical protein
MPRGFYLSKQKRWISGNLQLFSVGFDCATPEQGRFVETPTDFEPSIANDNDSSEYIIDRDQCLMTSSLPLAGSG